MGRAGHLPRQALLARLVHDVAAQPLTGRSKLIEAKGTSCTSSSSAGSTRRARTRCANEALDCAELATTVARVARHSHNGILTLHAGGGYLAVSLGDPGQGPAGGRPVRPLDDVHGGGTCHLRGGHGERNAWQGLVVLEATYSSQIYIGNDCARDQFDAPLPLVTASTAVAPVSGLTLNCLGPYVTPHIWVTGRAGVETTRRAMAAGLDDVALAHSAVG